jgi:ubiquinone/menaquinone biosynthesis C-methylase UbiE
MELKPGMSVADIGAGTGLYTRPMSESVGSTGRVYAVDISPSFLKHLRKLVMDQKLANVEVVAGDDRSTRLPPNVVDVAFVCDTYHHFEHPQETLKSIFAALKPGGMLVVVDFERIAGQSRDWTMTHVRAGKAEFRREIEQVGFVFRDEVKIEGFKENYLIRFRKL